MLSFCWPRDLRFHASFGKFKSELWRLDLTTMLWTLLIVSCLVDCQASLRVTRFDVPSQVVVGEPTRLICQYQISGFPLRAMKLFKDNQEFYRYVPSNRAKNQREHKLAFKLPGVDVLVKRSNSSLIYLNSVNASTSGLFKCQICAEDTYECVSEERELQVVEALTMISAPNVHQTQQPHKHSAQRQRQAGKFNGFSSSSSSIASSSQIHENQYGVGKSLAAAAAAAAAAGSALEFEFNLLYIVALSLIPTTLLVMSLNSNH